MIGQSVVWHHGCSYKRPPEANIRQLRNVIERAILASKGSPEIRPEHLGLSGSSEQARKHMELVFDHNPSLDEIKRTYLARLIAEYDGHRGQIAEALGVSERNTYRMIKKYDLH